MGPYLYHIQLINYESHSMNGYVTSGYIDGGYLDKHVGGHQITLTGGNIILNTSRGLDIGLKHPQKSILRKYFFPHSMQKMKII